MKRLIAGTMLAIAAMTASAETFSLTDTSGRLHSLAAYRGKWVMVNVWATWCAPCITEMPELEALSKAHPELVVIGLAADSDNPQRVIKFAKALQVSYPIVLADADLLRRFKVRAYPTTMLYGPDGALALTREGIITRAQVEGAMAAKGLSHGASPNP